MQEVILVIDESGAKGFSDNRESEAGQLGVIAGILIPTQFKQQVEDAVSEIVSEYKSLGKFHITDLTPKDQKEFRDRIFTYLLSINAYWVYEAIYVEGIHSYHCLISDLSSKAKKESLSSIKTSRNKRLHSLHQELFKGAFAKGLSFCIDQFSEAINLTVLTDKVDKSILKSFEEAAERLINFGKKRTRTIKGFDPISKTIVTGSVSIELFEGLDDFPELSQTVYTINQSDSALTIAADVLVNSVYHHLKLLQKETPGCPLNTELAISGHPLASKVYGVTPEASDCHQPSDSFYRYPDA